MNWTNATVAASFALFIVWMERQKVFDGSSRWGAFLKAAGGAYNITGSRLSTGSSSSGPSLGGVGGAIINGLYAGTNL